MPTFKRALPSLLLLTATLSSGCDKQEEAPKVEQINAPKVTLPAAPNFREGSAPEKYDGSVYSVYGLRQKIDELLAEKDMIDVEIRGYVQDIYVPPPCDGDLCPPPKQPHFWLVDHAEEAGKKRAMMVVNYQYLIPEHDKKRWKGQPEVIIEKGKQYTMKGRFGRFSNSGFAHNDGLIEFVSYHPVGEGGVVSPEWISPPGAPWHPVNVAVEQANQQKMAADAAKMATQIQSRGGKK